MSPLRWAVIGTSEVSRGFSRALGRVPDVARQAVISRDPARAAGFAKAFGFSHALPLGAEVFDRADIDVFYIATPTATHHALCLAAIGAGKHVVCEKPMTATPAELAEVQDAARHRGVFLMEGMWLRFNPIITRCRELLREGAVGEILSVDMRTGYQEQPADVAVRDGPARDALAVFGCYGFSLAEFLFGAPEALLASGRRDAQGAVLHAEVALRYPGFVFQLGTSIVATLPNRIEITGTLGTLAIPVSVLDPWRLEWRPHAAGSRSDKIRRRVAAVRHVITDQLGFLNPARGAGFRMEIIEVGAAIRRGERQCAINPDAATRSAHHLQACARAALDPGQGWLTMSASSF